MAHCVWHSYRKLEVIYSIQTFMSPELSYELQEGDDDGLKCTCQLWSLCKCTSAIEHPD